MTTAGANSCRVRRAYADKPDNRPDVLVAQRAAEAWGVLSLDELFASGLSRDAVSDRALSGRLHKIHRRVYSVGHANPPLEGRFLAAVKACGPGAVLSHHSAAALWGFMPWDDRHPEVTVIGTAPRAHPGLRVHRTTTLDRDDSARHRGIPVTSPARTLLDLAAKLEHRPLRSATRRAQSLHRVNIRQLVAILARHWRRPGSAKLARIVVTGPAPTRSELEDAVLDLILGGGLVHPQVNEALRLGGRRVVRISAGPRTASSSRPTAPHGTTTSSPATPTRSAKRCSRPTASVCCASPGTRRSPTRSARSRGCEPQARHTMQRP
jgi:hypothetical protein